MNTKFKLRKGDLVVVNSGKFRGTVSNIYSLLPKQQRVHLQKLFFFKKVVDKQGNRSEVKRWLPIDISNVSAFSPFAQKRSKISIKKSEQDGHIKLTRFLRKTNEQVTNKVFTKQEPNSSRKI